MRMQFKPTRKERVMSVLEDARHFGRLWLDSLDFPEGAPIQHQTPDGWVPVWLLCRPDTGGSQGDRRLRELRAEGVRIESRKREGSPVNEYRLADDGRLF